MEGQQQHMLLDATKKLSFCSWKVWDAVPRGPRIPVRRPETFEITAGSAPSKSRSRRPANERNGVALDQHLRVNDVAARMKVSPQTVLRIFEGREGVKVYGDAVGTSTKRRYRTILIPESLVNAVMQELEKTI